MSDERGTDTGADAGSDPAGGRDATDGDESSTEIPISTDENGADPTDDPTDGMGNDATDENGIEIEVETGSPGPDAERRSREETGIGDDGVGGSGPDVLDRFDETAVSLLSGLLDTETRLRVYVALRRRPWSTAETIAGETGLYSRTVRDALDALEARDAVERREPPGGTDATTATEGGSDGDDGGDDNGDPEYEPEYAAVAPTAVLTDAVGELGRGLPAGRGLDRYSGSRSGSTTGAGDPIRIDVEDVPEPDETDDPEVESDDASEDDAGDGYKGSN